MVNITKSPSDFIENPGESNAIVNQLPAAVMRRSMENKNLLQNKGSIYVGTGTQVTTTITSGADTTTYKTAKTAALPVVGNQKVLMADSSATLGLKWAGVCLGAKTVFSTDSWATTTSERGRYQMAINLYNITSGSYVTNVLVMKNNNGVYQSVMCDFDLTYTTNQINIIIYSNDQFTGEAIITRMVG